MFEDHSMWPAFSHSPVSAFFRWADVSPVVRPVFGWWNCWKESTDQRAHHHAAPTPVGAESGAEGEEARADTLYSSIGTSDPSTIWFTRTVRGSAFGFVGYSKRSTISLEPSIFSLVVARRKL